MRHPTSRRTSTASGSAGSRSRTASSATTAPFAEARYDLISRDVADDSSRSGSTHSDTDYVVIADPALDDIARSLTDTSKVLF